MSRSIFGWDLPPGCSVNDIPGNRPEDATWEAIELDFWEKTATKEEWELVEKSDKLMSLITKAITYGMTITEKRMADMQAENHHYEMSYIEEEMSKAKTPQEALDKIKKILGIGELKC
jgi:hypothetical protein